MQDSVFSLLVLGDTGWGDELLSGAWMTLQLAAVSLVCGLILGLILAGGRLSPVKPLNWLANVYIVFIRGTPEFLVLLLVFFGLDLVVRQAAQGIGITEYVEIPKFTAAVAGLSAIFGAYAAEVFRGAYLAVPPGQIEAALATGMSGAQVFFRIRLPQMWRFALPGLANLWMVLLKDTSLAAVIALDELLRQAKVASEATREPLLFYISAGVLYLVLTGISDIVRHRLEAGARRGFAR